MSDKYLGKIVVCRTAQGDIQFAGRCISYCDAPTVGVELLRGGQAHWRADMTTVVVEDEAIVQAILDKGPTLPESAT